MMTDTVAAPEASSEGMIPAVDDPYRLFARWMKDAEASEVNDPNAMSVATVDDEGLPSVRVVLMKEYDDRGFVFYTNAESDKGREMAMVPKAAACFHWKSLRRQVRVRGDVEQVTDEEADAYFATRPRNSQIGAWASKQSRTLEERSIFENRIKEYTEKFEGGEVPRPPYWTGFRIIPRCIEFWLDHEFRLHDRMVYERDEDGWTTRHLFP